MAAVSTPHGDDFEWSNPRDEDDLAWDNPKVEKNIKKVSPTTTLVQLMVSERQRYIEVQGHPGLPLVYSSKAACNSCMKRLRAEFTVEELEVMIRIFFQQIGGRRIRLRSTELWKDFSNAKAELHDMAWRSGELTPDRIVTQPYVHRGSVPQPEPVRQMPGGIDYDTWMQEMEKDA